MVPNYSYQLTVEHPHSMAEPPAPLCATNSGIQAPCSEVRETTSKWLQNIWQQLHEEGCGHDSTGILSEEN